MKRLTVKDIAKEVGVSTATISRVLNNNGYVSKKLREQIIQTIHRLNYQPNSIARSLKQKRSKSVGIVLPDMTNPYFLTIARQIRRKLMNHGYHLLFMDSEEDPEKEREALAFLMEKRVEALILAGTEENRKKIEAVQSAGIHVILIDRKIEGVEADAVTEDNRSSTEEAIVYLAEKGHKKIGIINGLRKIITAKERYEGVQAALRKLQLNLELQYFYEGDFTRGSGLQAIKFLMKLSPAPTAVFSANNEMTFGLYLGLHELGIRADAIEVVSFGDLEFSSLFQNKLSVILQNPQKIGDAAGEMALRRLSQPSTDCESRIFYPRMVPKSSYT